MGTTRGYQTGLENDGFGGTRSTIGSGVAVHFEAWDRRYDVLGSQTRRR